MLTVVYISHISKLSAGRMCLDLEPVDVVSVLCVIRSKFGQLGPGKGQFNSPHGFCLGMDEDIVVADTNNHRIQIFEKTGDFKYQFGQPGICISLLAFVFCFIFLFYVSEVSK